MKLDKKELFRTIKYTLIAMSAGLIQFGLTALFNVVIPIGNVLSYFIALVASVIWNFTINRKYTFKSANNVPKAMFLVFLYYLVFTPLSLWFVGYLGDGIIIDESFMVIEHLGWHWLIGFAINIFINFVTEFLFQKYVVFKGSIDTNNLAKKEQESLKKVNKKK